MCLNILSNISEEIFQLKWLHVNVFAHLNPCSCICPAQNEVLVNPDKYLVPTYASIYLRIKNTIEINIQKSLITIYLGSNHRIVIGIPQSAEIFESSKLHRCDNQYDLSRLCDMDTRAPVSYNPTKARARKAKLNRQPGNISVHLRCTFDNLINPTLSEHGRMTLKGDS